jgi:hypothetical protein
MPTLPLQRRSGGDRARRRWLSRLTGGLSAAVGTLAGVAPHVLHHIGPIAGAAVLTGAAGSTLFGLLGFLLMVPMLLRLRRRFGSWLAPGIALALFVLMFTVSTLWIGPAIRGDSTATTNEHDHSTPAASPH